MTTADPTTVYRRKQRSVQDAVRLIRAEDILAAPIATGQPATFLSALSERRDYRNLTLFSGLLIEAYPVLQQPGVRLVSGFYGPIERMLEATAASVDYLPADFLGWERYARLIRPRVV